MLIRTDNLVPPIEPRSGRARVDFSPALPVLLEVHQHVDYRMPHGARRGKGAGVVAVAPDRTTAPEGTVHRPSNTDRNPLDAAAEQRTVRGFDDEMEMIVLDRELDDPEATVGGDGEGGAHGREDPRGTKAADGMHRPKRDVNGVGGGMGQAGAVRHSRSPTRRRLATRSGAAPAPGTWRRKRQLQLDRTSHDLIGQ